MDIIQALKEEFFKNLYTLFTFDFTTAKNTPL